MSGSFLPNVDVAGVIGIPFDESKAGERAAREDVAGASAAEAHCWREKERSCRQGQQKETKRRVAQVNEPQPHGLDHRRDGARSTSSGQVEVQVAQGVRLERNESR